MDDDEGLNEYVIEPLKTDVHDVHDVIEFDEIDELDEIIIVHELTNGVYSIVHVVLYEADDDDDSDAANDDFDEIDENFIDVEHVWWYIEFDEIEVIVIYENEVIDDAEPYDEIDDVVIIEIDEIHEGEQQIMLTKVRFIHVQIIMMLD